METVNVVIDEASSSDLTRSVEEIPMMTFTSDPQVNHEELAEEPLSPSTPSTPSVAEVSDTSNSPTTVEAPIENTLSLEPESAEGK